MNKKTTIFQEISYFHRSILSTCSNQCTKNELFSLFSKCEYIRIILRNCSHILNKSLTENFIYCVVNIIGITTQSCKFLFKLNCKSLVLFTSMNTWCRAVPSLFFRNQFSACSKGLELSAQGLLHGNQHTFRTLNILQTCHWLKKSLETCW